MNAERASNRERTLPTIPCLHWRFSFLRRHRFWVGLLFLGVLVVIAAPHLAALHSWRAAEQALARHRPREAGSHLERCLRVWPRSAAAHLLAARAARLLGDYEAAEHHLLECQRLEARPSEDSLLEWALLKAETGDLKSVEDYLIGQARNDSNRVDAVREAMAAGYLRLYRIHEAMRCLEQCLENDPENLRALYLRGRVWERVHAYPKAVADYQEVVAHDPEHDEARLRLANCELENGQPAEALTHLEHLRSRQPDNAEVLVRLAFALTAAGQLGPALELIDRVLADHSNLPYAISARGQLAYHAERPAEAEYWLRKAIAANPFDRTAHYILHQCLEQQGKQAEARVQEKELYRVEETIERMLTIMNRLMPKKPHDPALHHELGAILMQMGKEELALAWFQSALREDPGYRPAHESLAQYYERVGNTEQALLHRQRDAPSRNAAGKD
jgi:tetratricopeptide (TPR) repeat protein